MKRWLTTGCLTAIIVAAIIPGLYIWQTGNLFISDESFAASPPGAIISVDEFMQNVERFRGPVRVAGVVSAVSPEQQTLVLIDAREFQECEVTTCAQLSLPVHWTGPMPIVQDTVQLEGEVQEAGGKLIFKARALKKVFPQSKVPK